MLNIQMTNHNKLVRPCQGTDLVKNTNQIYRITEKDKKKRKNKKKVNI